MDIYYVEKTSFRFLTHQKSFAHKKLIQYVTVTC